MQFGPESHPSVDLLEHGRDRRPFRPVEARLHPRRMGQAVRHVVLAGNQRRRDAVVARVDGARPRLVEMGQHRIGRMPGQVVEINVLGREQGVEAVLRHDSLRPLVVDETDGFRWHE